MKKLLSIQEAAKILGVSTKTLRRWEEKGFLTPQRTLGNQRRYTASDIRKVKSSVRPSYQRSLDQTAASGVPEAQHLRPPSPPPIPPNGPRYEKVSTQTGFNPSQDGSLGMEGHAEDSDSFFVSKNDTNINNTYNKKSPTSSSSEPTLPVDRWGAPDLQDKPRRSLFLPLTVAGLLAFVILSILAVGRVYNVPYVSDTSSYLAGLTTKKSQTSQEVGLAKAIESTVLAAQSVSLEKLFDVHIPANFGGDVNIEGELSVEGGIDLDGQDVDLGAGTLTAGSVIAPNVVNNIVAGTGITVTGGQSPVISNAGVTSLQGQAGALNLVAGSGISINGLTITNTAQGGGGSSANGFGQIAVSAQPTITAGSSNDTLNFAAGSNITLTTNTGTKTLTISATGGGGSSQWTTVGNDIYYDLGAVGIGTTAPVGLLNVNGDGSGEALVILNETGANDIFTASSAGTTRFVIENDGDLRLAAGQTIDTLSAGTLGIGTTNATTITIGRSGQGITLPGFTGQNGVLYATSGTGVLAQVTTGSAGQCLVSGGSAPSWGSCAGAGTDSPFNEVTSQGIIVQNNATEDLLLGGTSTASAKFAILNMAGGTPTASVSSGTNGSGIYLTASGNIQTTNNQLLTIGGNTTGNINLSPLNGSGTVTVNGNLNLPGLTPSSVVFTDASGNLTSTGTVGVGQGGTGLTATPTNGQILIGNGTGYTLATITPGTGIGVTNGAGSITIANNGVVSAQGTANQVLVNGTTGAAQTGAITLTLPQDIGTGSSPTFSGLTLSSLASGALYSNGGVISSEAQLAIARGGTNSTATPTQGGVAYGTGTAYAFTNVGLSGQVLISNGSSAPSWADSASLGTNYWQQVNGTIFPNNATVDLLVGGTSSSAAKFAVLNIANGNPTASVSSGVGGAGTYITADGTIQTTRNNNLTLGGSTTGQVNINDNTFITGNLNVSTLTSGVVINTNGTLASEAQLAIARGGTNSTATPTNGGVAYGTGTAYAFTSAGNSGQILQSTGAGAPIWVDSSTITGVNYWNLNNGSLKPGIDTVDLLVGGQSTSSAKFAVLNVGSGTPVASISSGTSGTGIFLSANGSLQTVNNMALTLGGGQTGNIILSGFGAGALQTSANGVVSTGTLPVSLGGTGATSFTSNGILFGNGTGAIQVTGAAANSVLVTNGSNVPSLSTTLPNAVQDNITRLGTIVSGVWNGTVIGSQYGGTGQDFSGATGVPYITGGTWATEAQLAIARGGTNSTATPTQGGVAYGTGTAYAFTSAGSSGQILQSNGTGAPTFVDPQSVAGVNYWNLNNGALSAENDTVDLLVGGQSTASAKFAVLNINSGTPTASVSGGAGGNATLITASGNIQTTNNQALTVGGGQTGGLILGRVGQGITLPNFTGQNAVLYATQSTGALAQATTGSAGQCLISGASSPTWGSCSGDSTDSPFNEVTSLGIIVQNNTSEDLLLGGTSTASAKFAFINNAGGTPTASVSSGLNGNGIYLTASGEIQTTRNTNLTLGGSTTGDINIAGNTNVTGSLNVSTLTSGAVYNTNGTLQSEANLDVTRGGTGVGTFTANGVILGNGTGDLQVTAAGTTGTVLRGQTGSAPVFGQVVLTTDVTGVLPIANGGTNSTATPTNGGVAYGTGTAYAFTAAGNAGQILLSNGAAAPTWVDPQSVSGINYWNQFNGALSAENDTWDLLIGGQSTASAKFAVLNVAGGTPVASVSSGLNGNGLSLGADGVIQATRNTNLTLGGSTTGQVNINDNTFITGNLNVSTLTSGVVINTNGTLSSEAQLAIARGGTNSTATPTQGGVAYGTGTAYAFTSAGSSGQILQSNGTGAPTFVDPQSVAGVNYWNQFNGALSAENDTWDLLIGGQSTASAKFAVLNVANGTPIASVSSGVSGNGLYLSADGTIQTTRNTNLTLGGSTTGDINISGNTNVTGNLNVSTLTSGAVYNTNGTLQSEANLDVTRGGTGVGTFTANGVILGNGTSDLQVTAAGTTGTVLRGQTGSAPVFGQVVLTTDVTGVLPIANGGTNSTATPTNGGVAYGTGTAYAFTAAGNSGEILQSVGAGTPIWVSPSSIAGVNYWNLFNGALSAENDTVDLLVGGQATGSAKFAVLNVNSGTPTASISSGLNGSGAYLTAGGLLQATRNNNLTFGGDTTGQVNINDNTFITGNLNVSTLTSGVVINTNGTLSSEAQLAIARGGTNSTATPTQGGIAYGTGTAYAFSSAGSAGQILQSNGTGAPTFVDPQSVAGVNYWNLNNGALSPENDTLDLLVGGQSTSSAKFAVLNMANGTPTTSAAGNLIVMPWTNGSSQVGGRVGIGTTNPLEKLHINPDNFGVNARFRTYTNIGETGSRGSTVLGNNLKASTDSNSQLKVVNTGGSSGYTGIELNTTDDRISFYAYDGSVTAGDVAGSIRMTILSGGNVGIGTTTPASLLQLVGGNTGGNAALSVNQTGASSNDIFTASSGGTTRFTIANSGALTIPVYAGQNAVLYAAPTTGVITTATTGSAGQCLVSGGSTPSWGSCAGTGTESPFNEVTSLGIIVQNKTTEDLLLGGTSTASAKFAFINNAGGTPTASVSSGLNGNGIYLTASGEIQTTRNTNLTLGGSTTGQVNINDNTFITGNLNVSTLTSGVVINTNGTLASEAQLAIARGGTNSTATPTQGGIAYGTGTAYAFTSAGTSGQILQSNGTGAPTFVDPQSVAGVNYWNLNNGALSPENDTLDLLVGGQSTASAKFAVLNVANGTPVASVSSGVSGNGIYLTAGGEIQTTRNTNLTLGGSTTGDINILGNTNITGSLNVSTLTSGVVINTNGTLASEAQLAIARGGTNSTATPTNGGVAYGTGTAYAFTAAGSSGQILQSNGAAAPTWVDPSGLAGVNYWNLNNGALSPENDTLDLLVGGQSTASVKFAVLNMANGTPIASVSSGVSGNGLYLSADGTIQTTRNTNLTLGGSTTGQVNINDNTFITGNLNVSTLTSGVVINTNGTLSSEAQLAIARGGTNSTATPTQGGIAYGTGTAYAFTSAGTSGQILQSNGTGAPTFVDPQSVAGVNYWNLNNGALSPEIDSLDLLVGGQSTASALTRFGGTAGANSFFNTGGNVGIGTTAPTALLDINGNLNVTTYATVGASLAVGYSNAPAGPGNAIFSGNVGIGTTAPTSGRLQIVRNSFGPGIYVENNGFTTTSFEVRSGGTLNGQITYDGRFQGWIGSQSAPTFSFHADTNTGFYGNGSDSIFFSTGGLAKGVITGSGNVGIGTTAPTTTLHVNGGLAGGNAAAIIDQTNGNDIFTASASGTTRFTIANNGTLTATAYTTNGGLLYTNGTTGTIAQTGAGNSGQILQSNGGGAPTWVDASSVGTNYWQRISGNLSPLTVNDTISATTSAATGLTITQTGNFDVVRFEDQLNDTTPFVINSNGRVGIGTQSADTELQLASGTLRVGNVGSATTGVDITSGSILGTYNVSDRRFGLYQNATSNLGMPAGYDGGVLLLGSGVAGASAITGGGSGQGFLTFFTGNNFTTPRMRIDTVGNVGIGTTSPTALLDVAGAASASGTFTFRDGGGTIQATTNDNLTLGGDTTGQVNIADNTFITGNLNVSTLTSGVVINTNGTLASEAQLAIARGGTNSTATPTNGGVAYGTGTAYAFTAAGSSGHILQSNGAAAPTWVDPSGLAGVNYWNLNNGALSPENDTLDLLVGGQSTASAKFAFINNAAGSPTATIGGNLSLVVPTGANPSTELNVLNGGTFNLQSSAGGPAGLTSRLFVDGGGNVGIGTTNPTQKLQVTDGSFTMRFGGTTGLQVVTTGQQAWTNLGTTSSSTKILSLYGIGSVELGTVTGGGDLGIGTGSPTSRLFVTGATGGNAAAIINQVNGNDIFAASASGSTRFVINNAGSALVTAGQGVDTLTAGTLTIGGSTQNGLILGRSGVSTRIANLTTDGVVYTSGTNGTLNTEAQLAIARGGTNSTATPTQGGVAYGTGTAYAFTSAGSSGQILQSNGTGAPTFVDPTSISGVNYWNLFNGALSAENSTVDLLVGGQSTASAKFAVLNVNNGTPVASVSSGTSGNGISLAADGTIQTTRNTNLTLGGSTTGQVNIADNTFITGNLNVSTLTSGVVINTNGTLASEAQLAIARGGTNSTATPTNGGVAYGTGTAYAFSAAGNAGEILQSNGAAAPTWVTPSSIAGVNYWNLNNGALSPEINTLDLLVGGQATTSAKFAVLNMTGSGTPTASVSAQNAANSALVLGGDSSIQAVRQQNLTLGGNTTGQVNIADNTFITGNLNVSTLTTGVVINTNGTLSSEAQLAIARGGTNSTATPTNGGVAYGTGTAYAFTAAGNSGEILQSNGAAAPTWISQNIVGPWQVLNGTVQPKNASLDLLIGGTSSGSAKFAVLNMIGSGTPTASVSSGLSGSGAYIAADGTIQSTRNTNLTLGGSTTGQVNISDNTFITGNLNVSTLTSGVVINTNGTLASEAQLAIARGGTNSTATPTNGGVAYGTGTAYAFSAAGSSGQILQSNGAAAPTWVDPSGLAGVNYWNQFNGALSAENSTVDLLIGGQSTASAKFAVLNINNGTPTASVSSGTSGNGLYLTAGGAIQTTRNTNLTLGGNTTGSILLSPNNGSGFVGINTLTPTNNLHVVGGTTITGNASINNLTIADSGAGNVVLNNGGFITIGAGTSGGVNFGNQSGTVNTVLGVNTSTAGPGVIVGDASNNAITTLSVNGQNSRGRAAFIVDQTANSANDILSASASGTTRFTVSNAGAIGLTSGFGTSGQCLTSGGTGTATWGDCATGTSSPFQALAGRIFENNTTQDFLIGGTATTSAKFAVLNMTGSGTPTTSAAGNLTVMPWTNGSSQVGGNLGIGTVSPTARLHVTTTVMPTNGVGYFDWSPSTATTTDGDLLTLNVGANGDLDKIFNVVDNGTSVFSISQTAVETSLPVSFNAPGDTSFAYDIQFTNPTASYVKSQAPLAIYAGEVFNSSNLTLGTYNSGNVVADTQAFVTTGAATVSGQLVVGTQVAPGNIGNLYLTNSSTFGKALAILNQTENTDIFAASASGTNRFAITNAGGIRLGSSEGSNGNCLLSGGAGAAATWGSCGSSSGGGAFTLNSTAGTTVQNVTTTDLLVGGTSTASAKFAVLNMTGSGTPVASISSGTSGNGLSLGANGVIQTTRNNNLVLGGNTTGAIQLAPLGVIGLTANLSGIGIGTTNPDYELDVNGTVNISDLLQVGADAADALDTLGGQAAITANNEEDAVLNLWSYESDGGVSGVLRLGSSNGTFSSPNPTQADEILGRIQIGGYDTAYSSNTIIEFEADGEWGTSGDTTDEPTRIIFNTIADGSGVATERLRIAGDGVITLADYTDQNGVLYGTSGTGVLAQATTATPGQCLMSGASNPTWGACATGTNSPFQSLAGRIFQNNTTEDFLIGGTATTSAKFGVLNVAGGTPTGTMAGNLIVMPWTNGSSQVGGRVGIGTTNPLARLQVNDEAYNTESSTALLLNRNASTGTGTETRLDFGTSGNVVGRIALNKAAPSNASLFFYTGGLTTVNSVPALQLNGDNRVFMGTALVDLATATPAQLYITGRDAKGNSALIINQANGQDIFTASASGTPRFSITNAGGIKLGTSEGTNGNCLLSGGAGSAATWGSCGSSSGGGAFTLNSTAGTTVQNVTTTDLLVGGNATSSAKFAVLNMTGSGTPTASVSSGTSGNGIYLTAGGAIQTTRNTNLTLGGNTTGVISVNDILRLEPLSGSKPYQIYAGNIAGGDRLVFNDVSGGTARYWFDSAGSDVGTSYAINGTEQAYFGVLSGAFRYLIYQNQPFAIDMGVNNTQFYLENGGDLGLGTTSPASKLHVSGASAGNALVTLDATGAVANDIFTASASGTPRFTIQNDGNLLSGTNVRNVNFVNSADHVFVNEESDLNMNFWVFSNTASEDPTIVLGRARGTAASPTAVQANDELGGIAVAGYDTNYSQLRAIKFEADAEWGTGADSTDNPFRMMFYTVPDGSGTQTERLRITSDGYVGIGETIPEGNLHLEGTRNGKALAVFNQTGAGTNNDIFTASASGTTRLTLSNTGTLTLPAYAGANAVLYAAPTTGVITTSTTTTGGLCLVSAAGASGTPSWGSCSGTPSSPSPFTENSTTKVIVQNNTTEDLLIGGTGSSSAKFAFLNMAGGTPTASGAGNLIVMPWTNGSNQVGGMLGIGTTAPAAMLEIARATAGTNDFIEAERITRSTTGTAASGIGAYTSGYIENSSGTLTKAGHYGFVASNVTAGDSFAGQFVIATERETFNTMETIFTGYATGGNKLWCGNASGDNGPDCIGWTIGSGNDMTYMFDGGNVALTSYDSGSSLFTWQTMSGTNLKFQTLGDEYINFDQNNDGSDLYIDTDGYVGVGTDNPGVKLDVKGSESSAGGLGAAIGIENTAAGGAGWYFRAGATGTDTPAGALSIGNSGAYRMFMYSDGKVSLGDNFTTGIGRFNVEAATVGKGLAIFNQTGAGNNNDILSASASGITRFKVGRSDIQIGETSVSSAQSINIGGSNGNTAVETIKIGAGTTASTTNATRIYIGNGSNNTRVIFKTWSGANGSNLLQENGQFVIGQTGSAATSGRIYWRSGGVNFRLNSTSINADYSEYMKQEDTSEPGDVMVFSSNQQGSVKKSPGKQYDSQILGVVTTSGTGANNEARGDCPSEEAFELGECGREENPEFANVGMLGHVYVKVTAENGNIQPGDPITTSSVPGTAMKATKAGRIIGYALEDYEGSPKGDKPSWFFWERPSPNTIVALIQASWHDPGAPPPDSVQDLQFAEGGEYGDGVSEFGLVDPTGRVWDNSIVAKEAAFGNVRAGGLSVEDLNVSGQANLASLRATDAVIDLSVSNGKLVVKGVGEEDVFSVDSAGNAYLKGMLTVDKVKANQIEGLEILTNHLTSLDESVASISGIMIDGSTSVDLGNVEDGIQILANRLDNAEARLDEVEDLSQTTASAAALLSDLLTGGYQSGSGSASFGNLENLDIAGSATISGDLTVLGRGLFSELGVTGTINTGALTIDGLSGSINNVGTLKLQESGLFGIELIAGKVVIDEDGNISTEGTITADKVEANTIKAEKIQIGEVAAASDEATGSASLSASAGSVIFEAGETEIEIETTALTDDSLIFTTPQRPVAVGAENLGDNLFRIRLENAPVSDLRVNWWIVN